MRYYVNKQNGRIADKIIFLIDNEVIYSAVCDYRTLTEENLTAIFQKINRKKRRGNLQVYGFFFQGNRQASGLFFMEVTPEYTDKEAFFCFIRRTLDFEDIKVK